MIGLGLALSRGKAGEVVGPVNTVAPAITGNGEIGSEHTVSTGTWTGTGTITYARQWRRDGVNIAGATGSAYTPVAADDLTDLTCAVTATDDEGSRSRTSAAVAITYAAPVTSGTPIDDVTFASDSGEREIDVPPAFTGGGITYSTTYGTMDGGILLADTDAPYPDPTTFTITITATNSGGSVTTTFDMTIDTLAPAVTGLTFDPDGDPNPTLAYNINRVGTVTAVVNNTASPTPEAVVAEHTTPGSETWASTQYAAEAGANSDALDISGVPDGTWWLHLVLPDAFGRYGIASAQFERTGSVADVTTLVPLGDGTISVTSLAAITALTATPLGDGTLEIENA